MVVEVHGPNARRQPRRPHRQGFFFCPDYAQTSSQRAYPQLAFGVESEATYPVQRCLPVHKGRQLAQRPQVSFRIKKQLK